MKEETQGWLNGTTEVPPREEQKKKKKKKGKNKQMGLA